MVNEFAYIFGIKALAKHVGFWYTSHREVYVQGIRGLYSNIGQWKDEFFFYPSRCSGEFRTTCKWWPVCHPSSTWLSLYFFNSFFFTDPTPILCLKRRRQSIWIFTTRCQRRSRTSGLWSPPPNFESTVFTPVVQLFRRTLGGKESSSIGLWVLLVCLNILPQVKSLLHAPFSLFFFFFLFTYL